MRTTFDPTEQAAQDWAAFAEWLNQFDVLDRPDTSDEISDAELAEFFEETDLRR